MFILIDIILLFYFLTMPNSFDRINYTQYLKTFIS